MSEAKIDVPLPDEVGFQTPAVAVTFEAFVKEEEDPATKVPTAQWFRISYVDPWDGRNLSGEFKARRLNLGKLGQVGVTRARLNGGVEVDSITNYLHHMLAYVSTVLEVSPTWWRPDAHEDKRVLEKVFEHLRQWEKSFRVPRVG